MRPENEKLKELLKGFRPQFGNESHIAISRQFEILVAKRKALAAREQKAAELDKELRNMKTAEEEIASIEANIIWILEKEMSPKT